MMKTREQITGFTLIELLLVIAVAGLLVAVTVPAFVDIGRGSRMKAAVNQLTGTLNLARQMAITKREKIHVLFPDAQDSLYGGLAPEHRRKALRSYAVMSGSQGYVSEWKYLPEGIYFIDQYTLSGRSQNFNDRNESINLVTVSNSVFFASTNTIVWTNFPAIDSPKKGINVLTFRPDGQVDKAGINPKELHLAEAIALDKASGREVIELVWKENPVVMGVVVRPFTGTLKIIDYTQLDER